MRCCKGDCLGGAACRAQRFAETGDTEVLLEGLDNRAAASLGALLVLTLVGTSAVLFGLLYLLITL